MPIVLIDKTVTNAFVSEYRNGLHKVSKLNLISLIKTTIEPNFGFPSLPSPGVQHKLASSFAATLFHCLISFLSFLLNSI